MNKIKISMCDMGFGADRIGIQHGYTMIEKLRPELAKRIEHIQYKLYAEDMKLENKKFYNTVYEATKQVYTTNLRFFNNGYTPLLLGGDHSLALGSVKASMEMNKGEDIGLVWIDAHTDINTFDSTESGNIHGMPVAALLGINDSYYDNLGNDIRLKPENLAFIGTRSIDYGEQVLVDKYDILNIMDAKIKATSLEEQIECIINHLKDKVKKIHISFDLDSINPDLIKGVSTPVPFGLELDGPIKIISSLAKEFEIVAIDLVEYNPLNDTDEKTISFVEKTIEQIEKL